MIKRLAAAGFVALASSTSACATVAGPENRADIGAWMDFYHVPGASVAVINDFALDYVEVHGVKSESTGEPVTERTLFQAASISKSVSAVGVMTLVQDGTVSLDTDVNQYLTSWQVPYNDFQETEKVTLRRLLSHTAGTTVHGFRGYRYPEPVPTLIQILNGEPPANSAPIVVDMVPGSHWRYSGGGYVIITQLVQDVTGSAFPDFIRERVLEPIGMEHSTFEQPLPDSLLGYAGSGYYADGIAVPGGHHVYPEIAAAALWTTATDIARFVIELQLSLRGESNKVLTTENVEVLFTEVMNDWAMGFGLRHINGQQYFWHAGANDGFRGGMLGHMSLGYGVVVQTNSDNGSDLTEAVIRVTGQREGWPGF